MGRLERAAITLIVFLIGFTVIANIFIAIETASYPWRILNWGLLILMAAGLGYFGWALFQELGSPVRHKPKAPNIIYWTADEDPLTDSNEAPGVSFGRVKKGSILCVSGGGYKSGLFNLGSIIALNEAGLLRGLETISSVSGGSFTIAWLAIHWNKLEFNNKNVATNFDDVIVQPLMKRYTSVTLDTPSIVKGVMGYVVGGKTASQHLADSLQAEFFGNATLDDLPTPKPGTAPNFCFNSSDLRTSTRWTFSKEGGQPQADNYKIGIAKQNFRIADVVAASAAFPPFFSPFRLKLYSPPVHTFSGKKGDPPWIDKLPESLKTQFEERMELGDGGIYGNMGLEEAKKHRQIYVSNAGDPYGETTEYDGSWLNQMRQLIRHYHRQIEQRRKIHAVDIEVLYTESKQREDVDVAIWQIEDRLSPEIAVRWDAPPQTEIAHKVATFPVRLKRTDPEQAQWIFKLGRAHALRELNAEDVPRDKESG